MALNRSLLAAVVFVAGLGVASAHANLILDPNFAGGGGSFITINAPGPTGPWTVGGSVDVIGGYWQAPAGTTGSVDLDGNFPGSVSQTFTAPAGTYLLSFALSGNPDGGSSLKQVEVSVGNHDPVTYSLHDWNEYSQQHEVSDRGSFVQLDRRDRHADLQES